MKTRFTGSPRHLALTGGVFLFLVIAIIWQAWMIHVLRATSMPAVETNALPMAELAVELDAVPAQQTSTYTVTISVAGSRSFTMPVQFTQDGRAVQVPPSDARAFSTQWIKGRAVAFAQAYSRMDFQHQPYLPIAVEHPGAP